MIFGRMPVELKSPTIFPVAGSAPLELELEDLLHGDGVAFHPHHLGDRDDLARAVLEARQLDDQVDGTGNLLADGLQGQVHAGHQDQGLEPREGLTGRVGVDRRHRSIVAGVHGLEHVEGLTGAALADHDAVGAHPQGVDDQIADVDAALAVDVRRARLEPAHVFLVELELGGVLDGDDPLVDRDEPGADVEEGRLPGTGAPGDDDVGPGQDARLDERGALLGDGSETDQVGNLIGVLRELPDGQQGAVERHRRDGGVDARSVQEPGIAERCPRVDPPADRRDDGVDDPHEVSLVVEANVGQQDLALAFDVHHLRTIDHDLGQAVVLDQRPNRPQGLHVAVVETGVGGDAHRWDSSWAPRTATRLKGRQGRFSPLATDGRPRQHNRYTIFSRLPGRSRLPCPPQHRSREYCMSPGGPACEGRRVR